MVFFFLGCNFFLGCSRDVDAQDDAGGAGGAGGGGALNELNPWAPGGAHPLYGEGDGTQPDTLRLRFREIPLSMSGGTTDLVFLPDARELLVTLREGYLMHVSLSGTAALTLNRWKLQEEILTIEACGPTNVLLDPSFRENGFIYISYCVDERVTRIVRYRFTESEGPVEPAVIFETVIEEPRENWHRVGSMGFEDDEIMWFLLGDHFIRELAQDVTSPFGGIHRIIPNRKPDGEGYEPAPGNMQLGAGGASAGDAPFESLYAYGFRSPWRGTRDSNGRFWVGDVGLEAFEELNLVTEQGQNFGWDTYEGPCEEGCEGVVNPVAFYDRSDEHPYVLEDKDASPGGKRAVWTGEIYEDPAVDRYATLMDGVVAFGDLFSGWVRGARADEDGQLTMNEFIGHLGNVTQWKVGPDGYIYVLDLNGQLHVALLDDGAD